MNRIIKALLCTFVIVIIIFTSCISTVTAEQPELELEAEAAVLMDARTGKILYNKNGEKPLPPASITKIMTLLIALEALDEGVVDKENLVTTSERAWRTGGSQMFLELGQQVAYWDMIRGIAIASANDACIAIAEHLYGSVETFVEWMNKRARDLGLLNTNFVNPHGIPHPEHKMSATDIAKLSSFFISTQPEGHALELEKEFVFNDIKQYNRNPLLGKYEGADGLKTGWTGEENAGYNLVGTAERNGMRLISVVLNNTSDATRLRDSEILLNYGFNNFELVSLATSDEIIDSIPLSRGVERELSVSPVADLEAVIPKGQKESIEMELVISEEVIAPVNKGDSLGTLQALLNGELLAEVEVAAAETVNQASFFTLLFRYLSDFFSSLIHGLFQRK
ncbi:MAG: D-alanyl-D-alanine carboxypeptidase family protein [Dethiobacteria bacterium]